MSTRPTLKRDSAAESVALDASVLINFLILQRVDILGGLESYRFVLLDAPESEITRPGQRVVLDRAIDQRFLHRGIATDTKELQVFAQLTQILGVGEAACLAAAHSRGWSVASDEKGAFRRIAAQRIGESRILTTPRLLAQSVTAGIITERELRNARLKLKENRFTIPPGTFAALFS